MVAIMEKTVDRATNCKTEVVNHKPEIDLFWLYARAATSRDPDELRDLSCSDCDPIRRRVASNPATPPDVLEWLSVDWHPPVRAALAENPLVPESLLEKLAQDRDREVRLALAKDLSVRAASAHSLLEVLAQDKDADVKEKAQQALSPVKNNVFFHPAKTLQDRVSRSA